MMYDYYRRQQPGAPIGDDPGGQHNMRVDTPHAPPNQGGPGNPGGANNMARLPPQLPRFSQQPPSWQNNKGPASLSPWDYKQQGGQGNPQLPMTDQWQRQPQLPMSDQWGRQQEWQQYGQRQQQDEWNRLPPEERARYDADTQRRMGGNGGINPGGMYNRGFGPYMGQGTQNQQGDLRNQLRNQLGFQQDPFSQYGTAGQSPQLGRYQPPMMGAPNTDPTNWFGGGGYSYNIPNSYGSGQWNQFNSTDRPFGNFGQSPNAPRGPSVGVQRDGTPIYQSPFSQPDPMRNANFQTYLGTLGYPDQSPVMSQPGTPDKPLPVT